MKGEMFANAQAQQDAFQTPKQLSLENAFSLIVEWLLRKNHFFAINAHDVKNVFVYLAMRKIEETLWFVVSAAHDSLIDDLIVGLIID